ncbi:hypothetical protein PIROE2DRAFT_11881 [Piromyces sp. E2]|nr:hypothetical protein PIROE2DRAFT_11881 [Piromyces sp. E2]|eukprot:OUM61958.1 hypothetical protein PIROE2DRAFT_11881 [Piromyces sp. E2]
MNSSKRKRNKGKNDHFFTNILASIAQYIPPNSPALTNYPKIRPSSQPTSDYRQLNLIQQWINKIYYQPDHHCSQCQSWYSIHSVNSKKAFQLFSSSSSSSSSNPLNDPSSKKFGYKANEAKKKKKHAVVVVAPNDNLTTTTTTTTTSNTMNSTHRPPQYGGGGGGGLFSRFFKSSPSSSASNSNTNIASLNNGRQQQQQMMMEDKNTIPTDSEEWVTIENQTYPLNQNTRMNSTQGITTNNFTMSPDTSLDKIYDSSFNYDFNMDSLSQISNSQQLQNILNDRDLLADAGNDPNGMGYTGGTDLNNNTFYTNNRIEEREKNMMEWDEESNLMNFGLNIANMITPSTLAEMDLDDIPLITPPQIPNQPKDKPNDTTNNEITNPTIDIEAILQQQQQKQQKQQKQADKQQLLLLQGIESLDYKKTEQKIHCCLSSSYYHIPPNTIVNECSSETCYFENRELIAQHLVHKLSYYLIAYRWAKRSVQLGLLVGQLNWITYLKNKNLSTADDDEFQETVRTIRRKEKRIRLLRLQRKREGINGEEFLELKSRKGPGSTTALQEIKELLSIVFLENSFRILSQYKDMIIKWYYRSLKASVFKIRTWDGFLEQKMESRNI